MPEINAQSIHAYFSDRPSKFAKKGLLRKWVDVSTGNTIKVFTQARLDTRHTSEQEALTLFAEGEFRELIMKRPVVEKGPLHLEVWRNTRDKTLYAQLRAFRSASEFVPLTDVVEIAGADYDAVFSRR